MGWRTRAHIGARSRIRPSSMIPERDLVGFYWSGLLRSYNRLVLVESAKWFERDSLGELDLYHFFFIRCYHFRDWLPLLTEIGKRSKERKTVSGFIRRNRDLRVCGNICNSHKHSFLDKPQMPEDHVADIGGFGNIVLLVREYYPHRTVSGRNKNDRLVLDIRGRPNYPAFELATNCVRLWRDFARDEFHVKLPGIDEETADAIVQTLAQVSVR